MAKKSKSIKYKKYFEKNKLLSQDNQFWFVQVIKYFQFRWGRWGSSLPGLRTLNPLLSPPSTPVEIFRRTCLQRGGVRVKFVLPDFFISQEPMQNFGTLRKGIIYLKQWPPSFMPAAKGSARTPIRPIIFYRVLFVFNNSCSTQSIFSFSGANTKFV